jgi:hypothetical protein
MEQSHETASCMDQNRDNTHLSVDAGARPLVFNQSILTNANPNTNQISRDDKARPLTRATVEVKLIEESGDILNDLEDFGSTSEIFEKKPSEVAPLICLKNSSDVDVNHKSKKKRHTLAVTDLSSIKLEVLQSIEFSSGSP